jgi:plastocyanin
VRKLLLVPALTAAALATAVPPALAAFKVTVGDNYFVTPRGVPVVSVDKGTKVKWVWQRRTLHNVKVTKGPAKFGSDPQAGGSYSKKLKKKGTYTIICTIHGGSDQKMKIVVD